MKIAPLPANGIAGSNFAEAPRIRISDSNVPTDAQAEKLELEAANKPTQTIKLKVNRTPQIPVLEEQTEQVQAVETISKENDKPVVEDTKPLDPQFAALARQRRALQVKEREIADREKALVEKTSSQSPDALIQRIKSEPLSVLQEYGVTYDQLTQSILDNQNYNPEIASLKAEIKALKEGVDTKLSDRDAQAEKQVLEAIRRDVEQLAQSNDSYELLRIQEAYEEVKNLIHRTWKEEGEVLDTEEAMRLVEEELTKDALKLANSNKLKSRTQQAQLQQQAQSKQIKTLTSRDTARPIMDRKARALAAALGQLRK